MATIIPFFRKTGSNRLFWLAMSVFIVSGCAGARHAVPAEALNRASIFGMRDIRAISGMPSAAFKEDFLDLLERENKADSGFFDFKKGKLYCMLAVSGGAANGAYGAGLLSGWSASGSRPVFQIVTGISTGAIIAPFAFLGSEYDGKLKELYTMYSTRDIMRIKFPRLRIPFSNSVATTSPLESLIERYFDAALLKRIAAEHKKGRRLYIGTTNLDAQRLVVWDMGKIACASDERALGLFRKIILASSSVPFAFPPVYLQAEVDAGKYDEMHVDGGISKQVFFLHDVLRGFDKAIKEKAIDDSRNKYAIYVIKNGYVNPSYKEVPDRIFSIAERTIDSITSAQGIGDLYQLYVFSRDKNMDFNLAYIPDSHVSKPREFFDPEEMKTLFEIGFKEALRGYPWRKSPPGVE